jgi:hypothetical protein
LTKSTRRVNPPEETRRLAATLVGLKPMSRTAIEWPRYSGRIGLRIEAPAD